METELKYAVEIHTEAVKGEVTTVQEKVFDVEITTEMVLKLDLTGEAI